MSGAMGHVVVVDANVWASRTLRDWICLIALEGRGMFTVRWTEDIMAETVRAVRLRYPEADGGVLTSVRDSITGTFPDGRIDDFVIGAPELSGPDRGDAHVRAAAAACGADMLVTDNLRDFLPAGEEETSLGYDVYSADEFLVLIDDSSPGRVRRAAERNLRYQLGLRSEVDLPDRLRRAGAPVFAARVRERLQEIEL